MRSQESGPGREGSPHPYVWVRHTIETHGRSRLPVTAGSLATSLLIAFAGHLMGVNLMLRLGIMFAVIATIALSHSISVRLLSQVAVTTIAKPGALSIHLRPVGTASAFLTSLILTPPLFVIGYQNMIPEAILGGIAGLAITLILPVGALLHKNRAFLHLSPETIHISTAFDDFECAWKHVHRIRLTDHRPGTTILIECRHGGLIVRKRMPVFSLMFSGPDWEFSAKIWGSSVNSLLSTLIYLHENPVARLSLQESELRAMLDDPEWATERSPGRVSRCLNSLFSKH
ncbi:hypothetical protein [Nocardia coubleae]|uniref:Uncharacterized protein n=1 Tax=Nocardia coubleae TaxID=356147 RepID=A0A846W1K3_9NOCA|nr:hypothetical protein [Nocardia coubleae]NKX86538.1 hypothetical protein [Nocardia coubleae]